MVQEMTGCVSINPATGGRLGVWPWMDENEVHERLDRAFTAQAELAALSADERAAGVGRIGSLLRDRSSQLSRLMTEEMGKPIRESAAEVEKCAMACDYYATQGPSFIRPKMLDSDAQRSFVRYAPLGVILAIMPWNYPLWQVFRCVAPALVAGNGIALKHASSVSACGLAIEAIVTDAQLPRGALTLLRVPDERVAKIIEDRRIAAVTLTGSARAGSSVAMTAGKALKKSVMELGGSDAFIVLEDANLDASVDFAVRSRFQNCGQTCIAAKRFFVIASLFEAWMERFEAGVGALKVGDPMDPATDLGPLARADLRDLVAAQVDGARASVTRGGHVVDGDGWFYAPTICVNPPATSAVLQEETFGPVAAVVKVASEGEAIAAANATEFGLGASVWTRDTERGILVARALHTGGVFINGMTHSDPRLPFGGVGASGFGRELFDVGMHEFMNLQTVWVA